MFVDERKRQAPHRDFKISVFEHTIAAASQLFGAFFPDHQRLGRSEHLACQVDGLSLGSPQTNRRTFFDERRFN